MGRPGQLASLLSHWGGLRPPQTPPQSSRAEALSSTVCSRELKLPLGQSVGTLKCSSLQYNRRQHPWLFPAKGASSSRERPHHPGCKQPGSIVLQVIVVTWPASRPSIVLQVIVVTTRADKLPGSILLQRNRPHHHRQSRWSIVLQGSSSPPKPASWLGSILLQRNRPHHPRPTGLGSIVLQ